MMQFAHRTGPPKTLPAISPLPVAWLIVVGLMLASCNKKQEATGGDTAPPPAKVVTTGDMSLVSVDKPDQFPLVQAEAYNAPAELHVTGTVSADVSRQIPVASLASGRVVDIRARLNDNVKKGQLLLKIQSPDSTNAFNTYLKAVNDERLTNKEYIRAKDLYQHGAISQAMLEQAENAESDATSDLKAAEEMLETLGFDKNHPSPIVPVYSPISGVIIQQNVTQAAATGVTFAGSANAFVIADLSVVWVICDVYENDIPKIALGQEAKIALASYPLRTLVGHISDIGPSLDPATRTAKVRIEVANPGILRLGMFVTATLVSRQKEDFVLVPAPSVLHLHDRDWVFVPAGNNQFRRVAVNAGQMVSNKQAILSGVKSGQQVVSNVLQLEATLEAQ
jgi:membrane fusion protein, heavy metal efflux system